MHQEKLIIKIEKRTDWHFLIKQQINNNTNEKNITNV